MCLARCGSGAPGEQPCLTLAWYSFDKRLLKPIIEGFGNLSSAWSELTQVVVAQTTADYQNPIVSQRRKRATDGQVDGWVVARLQVESSTTGTLASGYMTTSGVKVPWSKPRCGSIRAGMPAASIRVRTRCANCGEPGALYFTW